MKGSQKILKIISVIMIIYATLVILLGAFMCFGGMLPGIGDQTVKVEGVTMGLSSAAIAFGAATVINGVVELVIGLLGLRGAKNPAKIGAFFVVAIIGAVLSFIGLGMSFAQGTFNLSSLIGLAVVLVCVYLGYSIKKNGQVH